MRALVTGGTGFIGKRLINAVHGEIRFLSRTRQSNYETIICDLQSGVIPDDTLDGVDTVFHLAGFAHDMRDPSKIVDLYYKVNVSATVQLAELAVRAGVKRFVFVSSVKAGGPPPSWGMFK
jgi:nucleoside-diphosphate-sugar epimerase